MTDLASDVVIKVGEMSFHLHKVLSVFSLFSIISIIMEFLSFHSAYGCFLIAK